MKLDVPGAMPDPTENGEYAAEVYFGWKLLEWKDGHWHHVNSGRWPLEVVQWIKLPECIYFEVQDKKDDALEFDL